MARSTENAYTRMKSSNTAQGLLKHEETYFAAAAIPVVLIAGIFDGGLSLALFYGARQMYKKNNGGR